MSTCIPGYCRIGSIVVLCALSHACHRRAMGCALKKARSGGEEGEEEEEEDRNPAASLSLGGGVWL